ncbi:hypothetical protein GCM10010492_14650 [Saccharothrix mutabilis subsp. mutabilis]|uniref:Mycothiol-dependent maleylpyruvate isomerase metal-binding domain-containing protein n=2 Tax=Saccharothrix mutabilis TaxID=33921 RepID=A0ABN0TC33_9PSEU
MGILTGMREHLERVAVVLDEVMAETAATGALTPWEHVDWLRLHADLLDRLGAAAGPASAVSGRGELVRDQAERLADRLNGLPGADLPNGRHGTVSAFGGRPALVRVTAGDEPFERLVVAGDLDVVRVEPEA